MTSAGRTAGKCLPGPEGLLLQTCSGDGAALGQLWLFIVAPFAGAVLAARV